MSFAKVYYKTVLFFFKNILKGHYLWLFIVCKAIINVKTFYRIKKEYIFTKKLTGNRSKVI